MLTRTVSLNSATSWGTRATAWRREAWRMARRSMPSRVTAPDCGSIRRRARRTRVVLPAPEVPTMPVVEPGGVRKLTPSSPCERAVWRKETLLKARSAPWTMASGRSRASGASATAGTWRRRSIIASMSITDWRISR